MNKQFGLTDSFLKRVRAELLENGGDNGLANTIGLVLERRAVMRHLGRTPRSGQPKLSPAGSPIFERLEPYARGSAKSTRAAPGAALFKNRHRSPTALIKWVRYKYRRYG